MAGVIKQAANVRVLRAVRVAVAVHKIMFEIHKDILGFGLLGFVVTGVDVRYPRARVGKSDGIPRRTKLRERILEMPGECGACRTGSACGLRPRSAAGGGKGLP